MTERKMKMKDDPTYCDYCNQVGCMVPGPFAYAGEPWKATCHRCGEVRRWRGGGAPVFASDATKVMERGIEPVLRRMIDFAIGLSAEEKAAASK